MTQYNWRHKVWEILQKLELKDRKAFDEWMIRRYKYGLSCNEISEIIEEKTGIHYTERSVLRRLIKNGITTRKGGEAFQNAIRRGRVKWQLREARRKRMKKKALSPKLRMQIFERDGFKCVLCGSKEELQVDHIVARIHGGGDEEANLRTLCLECNNGKRLLKKEGNIVGGLVSGKKE